MRKRLAFLFAFCFLGFCAQAFAQFLPEEVAEWPKWEEFLTTANINVKDSVQLTGPGAVTSPWKLTLEKDGVKRFSLWKNARGLTKGYVEGWQYEIAAYQMDKLLGLNMVAPTIERRYREELGSLQLWMDSMMSYNKYNEEKAAGKTKMPSYKVFPFNRATYLHRAFDNLIANEDRHANNILFTSDWRIFLIDHSRSFRTSKKFTENLIYTEKHKEGDKSMKELPRAFVDKLKGLTLESIKGAVGNNLTDDEINACLKRRDLILKEIDRLIKLKGEENVLY
jgi:hypothetical protein